MHNIQINLCIFAKEMLEQTLSMQKNEHIR